jgi:hypothetical protein
MLNNFYSRFKVFSIFSLGVFFLFACGTTGPSKFYTLNSLQTFERVGQVASEGKKLSVTIDPVEIPDYLDRPQIVVRNDHNEIAVSEYDRWAGSLQDNITRVLAENLSVVLRGSQVSIFPSRPGLQSDYRIKVYITRFDIMPDDTFSMRAQWTILGKDGVIALAMREANLSERTEGRSYSDKVAAMSRTLESLSREIASEIKKMKD